MNSLKLLSKAKTLEALSSVLTKAKILPLYRFTLEQYSKSSLKLIEEIQSKFNSKVIVRSSALNEDSQQESNAGTYESVMNIDCRSVSELENAIDQIVKSYGKHVSKADEVFIQPMVKDVTMAGVIFSSDIDTLSPYYIINYDESGSTHSVTSGNSNALKSFISYRDNDNILTPKLHRLIKATKECEKIFKNNFLDIEFAFSGQQLYILQVRAIVAKDKENLSSVNLSKSLYKLHNKINKLNISHPNLLGDRVIFGIMPDWNPAEMIGKRPKRLALSLYKDLITDETWAYQRDNYGYRNLRSHPLLISFLGVPYIDVRISFNSFIPKQLNDTTATKLVNYYLDELSKNTKHHDKVEFEIIFSCYYFGIEKKLEKLKNHGFSGSEIEEIRESLLSLTNKIIDVKHGLYKKDLQKIEVLKEKFDNIVGSNISPIDKIYWLIKDVKRYGTLPFAGIARGGFIAMQILKSFIDEKIITTQEYGSFLNSLNTISTQLSLDSASLTKEEFLKIYGHLRPGTYDIESKRYDEAYETYFKPHEVAHTRKPTSFAFSSLQKEKIKGLISKNGLNTTVEHLLLFIKESIEGREYAKFVFTKHLSQILKHLEKFGKRFGFNTEELAYLDIQTVLNLYATLDNRDVVDILRFDIEKNKELYRYTKAIKLPNIILNAKEIYSFYLEDGEANFVTLGKIVSCVVLERDMSNVNLEGKIVCIESADPGYDYLFSKNIGGLITCYGGANSHMAIRCAEMSIPAVIGCGEHTFTRYSQANIIVIDALNKQVKILS